MWWKYFINAGFFIGLLVNATLFVPQAIKLYRIKTAKEVSPLTFLGFNIMQAFTAIHAYLAKDALLFLGMVLSFITCGAVTYLAFLYRLRS